MDIDILISEVEKRPVIWDTSSEAYKDRNKRNESWIEVCQALYSDFDDKLQAEKETKREYYFIIFYNHILLHCHAKRPLSLMK